MEDSHCASFILCICFCLSADPVLAICLGSERTTCPSECLPLLKAWCWHLDESFRACRALSSVYRASQEAHWSRLGGRDSLRAISQGGTLRIERSATVGSVPFSVIPAHILSRGSEAPITVCGSRCCCLQGPSSLVPSLNSKITKIRCLLISIICIFLIMLNANHNLVFLLYLSFVYILLLYFVTSFISDLSTWMYCCHLYDKG